MLNRWFGKFLSFTFITSCLFIGIGIGAAIRMGKIQASDQPPKPAESLPILPPATEEQIFPDSITIQAVGDVIPGTNYPNNRLPGQDSGVRI
ncbi:hypothetical protein [Calothrix sp. UHCC 0171]|uniref:hypothetical protein n=1 Tax=Calothrix sp. UHCC 0171 TaxID=3110245 RepID=UPI002B1EC2DF|nr:hypothetical protein [Calothrix sp. UHCC 0171]MEA5574463.1 hypothetical protein [Calothrix sp. UHCC 0171]